MIFLRTSSFAPVAEYLTGIISGKLKNDKKVLWLISGGSSIPIAISASQDIAGPGSSLFMSLTDERPGPIGHPDSNWLQLQNAGLAYQNREYYEILQNKSTSEEVIGFDAWLGHMLASVDYKIGLFGIGADGHTAGILQGDSLKSSFVNSGYYDDGQRQRISITPEAISMLDEVVVYLTGDAKRPILDMLQTEQDPNLFPAQHLKSAGKLTVYNNWIGESV